MNEHLNHRLVTFIFSDAVSQLIAQAAGDALVSECDVKGILKVLKLHNFWYI